MLDLQDGSASGPSRRDSVIEVIRLLLYAVVITDLLYILNPLTVKLVVDSVWVPVVDAFKMSRPRPPSCHIEHAHERRQHQNGTKYLNSESLYWKPEKAKFK